MKGKARVQHSGVISPSIITPRSRIMANPWGLSAKAVATLTALLHWALHVDSAALNHTLSHPIDDIWWLLLCASGIGGLLGYMRDRSRPEFLCLVSLATLVAVLWAATIAYYGVAGLLVAPFLPAVTAGALGRAYAVAHTAKWT